ncbi:MAG TPA: polysaccharide deacetylase family protein [Acidimicrobiia bacterium]|jgi:peptidoglycan/xylan/chitin deacetylase (PgdA/CDA1 family)|nr:polysaccharide deacetylase family protein [Acidimicrobiia bacterium]
MGAGLVRTIVKAGAAAVPAGRGTVVLIYHRVGASSALDVDLATAEFAHQMEWLATRGGARPLAPALETLQDAATDPHDVVVTFDDGTADFAETALPVLVEHHIPVTLYLATAFIEEQRPFPDDGRPLTWAALRDACSTGLVDVASHTHTHAVLDRLPPGRVADELDRSRRLIEDRLGRPCTDFAYPKAIAPSDAADAQVRARFRSAALAGTRANRAGHTDPHRLARSPIQRSDGRRYFERKVAGGMGFEDTLRRAANRWRYRNVDS